jgi:hypothetical protein
LEKKYKKYYSSNNIREIKVRRMRGTGLEGDER